MSRFRSAARLALAGLLVLSCGAPTLDPDDLDASIGEMRAALPEERRGDFDHAIGVVRRASTGEVEGTEPFGLGGLTAAQVFATAEEVELRREIAWAEREVALERETVDAASRLARLVVDDLRTQWTGERIEARFAVTNGLDEPVDTGWLRISVGGPSGRVFSGEDMVDFRPRLRPGESRRVVIPVTSEAARGLPPEPGVEVEARFTLIERGGDVLLQEASPEELAEAHGRLVRAERRLAELRARLSG